MNTLLALLVGAVALAVGAAIGIGFGLLQEVALRRHTELERSGRLGTGWSLLPGAGGRVACLLATLAGVQIVCPLFFAGGTEWLVSGGLVAGYGYMLARQMRHRLAAKT